MSIKSVIKEYVGDYREFYANDLFKFVRGILGRPLLHDDSIIRKLREMRDEEFDDGGQIKRVYYITCTDHKKSRYKVTKIKTGVDIPPKLFSGLLKNKQLFLL